MSFHSNLILLNSKTSGKDKIYRYSNFIIELNEPFELNKRVLELYSMDVKCYGIFYGSVGLTKNILIFLKRLKLL